MPRIGAEQWNFIPDDEVLVDISKLNIARKFYFFIFVFWTIAWLVGVIWYICKINRLQIQIRSPILTLLSVFGSEIALLFITLQSILGESHFPCFLDVWCYLIFFPMAIIPYFLKFSRYYINMFQLEKWKNREIKDPKESIWVTELPWIGIFFVILSIFAIISVVFQFTILSDFITSYGCALHSILFWPLLVGLVGILILSGFLFYTIVVLPDPYSLKNEALTTFVLLLITICPYFILELTSAQQVHDYDFIILIFVIGTTTTNLLRPLYLSYKRPPQNKSGKVLESLEDILKDKETYELLEKIAISHDAYECLPFYSEMVEFREITDPQLLAEKANHIYNEYIRPGAPHWNNLDHRKVKDIEQRLSQPTSDMFNATYREILKLLQTNFMPELKVMPDYERILQDRMKKIEEERKAKYLLINEQN